MAISFNHPETRTFLLHRLFTASRFTQVKEKASESRAKHGVLRVEFVSKTYLLKSSILRCCSILLRFYWRLQQSNKNRRKQRAVSSLLLESNRPE